MAGSGRACVPAGRCVGESDKAVVVKHLNDVFHIQQRTEITGENMSKKRTPKKRRPGKSKNTAEPDTRPPLNGQDDGRYRPFAGIAGI